MKYEANWESLKQYTVPEWFKDAKLGVFIHWGVYAVPGFSSEWYPRNMYRSDHEAYAHHRETWGPQSEFGYRDFVPMFKAGNWDPTAWVSLFKEAGAKYVVPVAEHHDGFPMYATEHTDWNAANMGPRRDVVAELETATRSAGLKFGVSSHRAFNWRYYTFADDYDTTNPANAGLYGPSHGEEEPASPEFLADWFGRTKELIDKFRPDLLWFDFGWHREEFAPYRPQVTAYYYNCASEWGREVVLNYKAEFPDGVAVLDIERGKLDDIRDEYWQTDTSVSYRSWCYIEDDEFKTVTAVVHDLIDIVSKNGNLLLNVGPRADGAIPYEATAVLRGLGDWLRVNGEAIYGTRPWRVYGEGSAKVIVAPLRERENEPLSAKDIRFTANGNCLYAIFPRWPGREALVTSLAEGSDLLSSRIERVTMLGFSDPLEWRQDDAGLHVELPTSKPCDHAYTLKIALGARPDRSLG